ncbi:xylulokinase [Christensenella timonensis]|uniref:xylulokinase n=1 Tax=Christensenella timonensis TaxID=1816678 RepID=UPI0008351C9B|nr:FGGY family carbohydrate kinase [Christensenella timonensis]
MKHYIIGIDIGTQGTKSMIFDTDMNVVASAFEQSCLISPKPGTVWQQPEEIYLSCVRTIKQMMDETQIAPASVLSIAIDGQMAGIIGIDREGNAVTPYDSWLDTRCGKYLDILRETSEKELIRTSGGQVTYGHAPKIIWWKNEHSDIYNKICKFVVPQAYVVGKMTGLSAEEQFMDYTCIVFSGFGDTVKKAWSENLLREFNIDKNKLPRMVSPFDIVGTTKKEFGDLCGLREGIPVAAGAGDTAASTFGAGHFEENTLLDCAGTASNLCAAVREYVPDLEYKTLIMLRSPIDGLYIPLSYINGGGLCIKWFQSEFTGEPHATYEMLEKEAEMVEAGSEGIFFIPHFAGRVLPNDPDIKGSFSGLDWKHKRAHLYRAIMEGIAYEYWYYFSVLKTLYPNVKPNVMRSIGGGSKSRLFCSIKADVLGMDVIPLMLGDAALVGSAVIGAVGAGIIPDYREAISKTIDCGNVIRFCGQNYDRYQKYAQAYQKKVLAMHALYTDTI